MSSEHLTNEASRPYSADGNLINMKSKFCSDCEGVLRVSSSLALRLISALWAKRFVIFTGLSGSGKTQLALALARWLTPIQIAKDPFVPGARIQSAKVTYIVMNSDRYSVEFWNSDSEQDSIKVTLPREMIREWADFINAHGLTRDTQAREIREAVKPLSKFSDQLHSFETILKAAAFALLDCSYYENGPRCYEVVAVGADWTGNDSILGYPNGLDNSTYIGKPTLELILRASKHPGIPYFLILDEMNLSHVERYFADLLSVIESRESIALHGEAERVFGDLIVPPQVRLPENLFIIGTVNVDETTYMFSPKVLDRANVIEFRLVKNELESFLGNPQRPDLSKLDGKGELFQQLFVDAANSEATTPENVRKRFEYEMLLFFEVMQPYGAEFGYRVVHESARFLYFYQLLGGHENEQEWFAGAFDCVVVQKLLPKLHGSRARLGPLLKALWFLCSTSPEARGTDALTAALDASRSTEKGKEPSTAVPPGAPYPISAEKLGRMWRLLRDNGFTSFAEA